MEINYKKTWIHQTVNGVKVATDVYLPDFKDEFHNEPVGIWGQRHLEFIKKNRRVLYNSLLIDAKLNAYLVDIDRQAREMLDTLIKQMQSREGVTEEMKSENQMAWVQAMNNIRNRAEEVVYNELVYT